MAAVTTLPDLHATDSGELRQIFCTCFQLQASKNAPVYNTASATLRQLTVMLFDRASIENQGLDNSNANTENNNATPNDNALTTKTVGTPNQSPLTMAKSTSTNSVLSKYLIFLKS